MAIKKIKSPDGSQKWEVRAYENGRGSKRIQRTFDRKIDAEAFLHSFQQQKAEASALNPGQKSFKDKTLGGEANLWFEDAKLRFSPGHLVRCKSVLFSEVLPKYGKTPIEMLTPDFMKKYQHAELKKGLLPPTVNRKTEILMAVLNFSTKQQRIPYHPALGFRKFKHAKKEMLFWDREEALSFLQFSNSKYKPGSDERWIHVAYLLVLNTAIRAGETWAIRPMDIGSNGKFLYIRRQFNRVSLDFAPTKGKTARIVPCNPELLGELQSLIAKRRIGKDQTIFQNEAGRPICHDNFAKRTFARDLVEWGGRRIRFHDLRHTATTLMISNLVDLKTVKEICGHENISTTMDYSHLLDGNVAKVSNVFQLTVGQGGGDR